MLCDEADMPLLESYAWRAEPYGRTVRARCGQLYAHRLLCTSEHEVDHKNGDGLDNRRENLRPATKAQNQHNKTKYRTNTSGYKGVSWLKSEHKWQANIKVDGRQKKLGRFDTAEAAHLAYAEAARELHGEFSNTGELPDTESYRPRALP